ncbi:MAG: ATP cone domain-containing protein, partial [Bacilli bacterium]
MLSVKKRDGQIVDFNISKIENAMINAFEGVGRPYSKDIIELLALRVTANFGPKIVNDVISVEDIQDSVEVVLIQASYVDVAKAYILYRKKHENIRNISSTILDYKEA